MYFVVYATDKPGTQERRIQNWPAHRQYLRHPGAHPVTVRVGGPLLTETAPP